MSIGKRYNVLRNRIDPWDYDVDQLLFGTILFTLVAFLFPTILAYYTLFAMVGNTVLLQFTWLILCLVTVFNCPHTCPNGSSARFHQPFPSLCVVTESQRSMEAARFVETIPTYIYIKVK